MPRIISGSVSSTVPFASAQTHNVCGWASTTTSTRTAADLIVFLSLHMRTKADESS